MSSLELSFAEIYNKTSEVYGTGSAPTGTDLTNAKAMVYRGYRQFLFPIDKRTGRRHIWSFLKRHLVFLTQSGQWQYELPINFKETDGFFFDKDTGYSSPKKVSAQEILKMRALGTESTYPSFYALVRTPYDATTGASWQVWFYGEPDDSYRIHCLYIINPEKPSATTDVFVGGVEAAEAILESCLAITETEGDEKQGVHTAEANRLIQTLIQNDFVDIPDTVGKMLDVGIYEIRGGRFLQKLTESDVYQE
jgi:hypothetical protein